MFLKEHKLSSNQSLSDIEHIVVLLNAELTLWKINIDGQGYTQIASEETSAKGQDYTIAKEICHIPVLIISLLQPIIDNQIILADKTNDLDYLARRLTRISARIVKQDNKYLMPDNTLILDSIQLIEEIKKCSCSQQISTLLTNYMSRVHDIVRLNSTYATEIQINSLDEIMSKWKKNYDINLMKSRILIVGPHGPRNQLIEQQYFTHLYKELGLEAPENDKLYYVEVLPNSLSNMDIKKDIIEGFLCPHEMNKKIGQAMFKDKKAMFTDILSEYGPGAISMLKNKQQDSDINEQSKCPYSKGI